MSTNMRQDGEDDNKGMRNGDFISPSMHADAFDQAVAMFEAEGRVQLDATTADPVLALCACWMELESEANALMDRLHQRSKDLEAQGRPLDTDHSPDPVWLSLHTAFDRLSWNEDAVRNEISLTPARTVEGALAKLEVWMVDQHVKQDGTDDNEFARSAALDLRCLVGSAVCGERKAA